MNLESLKLTVTEGKYGPIYHLRKGIRVGMDSRRKWTLFQEIHGNRKNTTFGETEEDLTRAITTAVSITEGLKSKEIASLTVTNGKSCSKTQIPTFMDSCNEWFDAKTPNWAETTVDKNDGLKRNYLAVAPFANTDIDLIKDHDILLYLETMHKDKSHSIIESLYSIIHGVFKRAVKMNHITINPSSELLNMILPIKSKRRSKQPDPFTKLELRQFFDHAENICGPHEILILKFMGYCGFRLGESLAVKREFLDLNNEVYNIREQFNSNVIKPPKNNSCRKIPLPHDLINDINVYTAKLDNSASNKSPDYLFLTLKRKIFVSIFSPNQLRALMKKICDAAGLRRRRLHDLRHTYATLLLSARFPMRAVMDLCGHKKVSTTVEIYGTWIPNDVQHMWQDVF